MTFALLISCNTPGCTAEASITPGRGSWDGVPALTENLPDGRAHFVVDTGWLMMPPGWTFADDGDRCPSHAERTQ